MEKLKEKITVPNIIIVFILLQPIIDMLTGLSMQYTNLTITFGIVIRTIFIIFLVVLGFIKANKKYKVGMSIYYGALLIYMISFLVSSYFENGTNLIFLQIKGLIKNFYLPITLVAFVPIFKAYKIEVTNKVLTTSLMIYVVTIFVCSILGIAFLTYKAGDKAGTVGLFYSANEIGAILCLLSPFFIIEFVQKKVTMVDAIFIGLFAYAVLQLGTKVPYFGLILLILMIVVICFIKAILQKKKDLYKKASIFFSFLIVVYLVTGFTPVGKNLTKIYGDIFVVTWEDFQSENEKRPPQLTEFKDFEELKTTVVSERNDFLRANKAKFMNGKWTSKLFGIGFVENTEGILQELKLTEMDYYDILFCNGIIGTILFALPILIFGIIFMRDTILNKRKIEIEFIYSIGMAMIVALLAGHVLVSPAVSIYIVIILLKYKFSTEGTTKQEEIKEGEE